MSERERIAKKLLETIRRHRLFNGGEGLIMAVSGGIDSVVLLHLLQHLPDPFRPRVKAAHFNHRLRGAESQGDEDFVKDLCSRWEVPLHLGEAPDWKTKSNLQARARELRYDFLKKTASASGFRRIATAHQADDQTETFLIRWLQGAGLKGLSGIPMTRGEGEFIFVRPLLLVSRAEIDAYAREEGIPFREDSTNEGDLYLRNRVRKLLAGLKGENPNLAERSALNAAFLQADQAFLESKTEAVFEESVEKGTGRLDCSIKVYRSLPEAIRFRLLQKMVQALTAEGAAFPAEAVLKIDELILDPVPEKQYDLPKGIGFQKEYIRFALLKKS